MCESCFAPWEQHREGKPLKSDKRELRDNHEDTSKCHIQLPCFFRTLNLMYCVHAFNARYARLRGTSVVGLIYCFFRKKPLELPNSSSNTDSPSNVDVHVFTIGTKILDPALACRGAILHHTPRIPRLKH